jgi:uncharacterized surface protein with fasciclin (FAS1) repeats
MFRRTLLSAVAAAAVLGGPALSQDIVDVAAGSGSFQMLVQALQATGLDTALKGAGPFTVFAPDDGAFAPIEEGGEFEELLMSPDKLSAILSHHVVAGTVMAADLTDGMTLTALDGGTLTITLNGGPMVEGAAITAADVAASNGVIHVIDRILMPAE